MMGRVGVRYLSTYLNTVDMTNDGLGHEDDSTGGLRPLSGVHHRGGGLWDTRMIPVIPGLLFLLTFTTAIPTGFLYGPVLDNTDYIVSSGADSRVSLGAVLELPLIIANIGTAVVLVPILEHEDEILALGYVTARLVVRTPYER